MTSLFWFSVIWKMTSGVFMTLRGSCWLSSSAADEHCWHWVISAEFSRLYHIVRWRVSSLLNNHWWKILLLEPTVTDSSCKMNKTLSCWCRLHVSVISHRNAQMDWPVEYPAISLQSTFLCASEMWTLLTSDVKAMKSFHMKSAKDPWNQMA